MGLAGRCYSQERMLQGLFLTTCPLAIAGSCSQPCNLICCVSGTSSQYNLVSPHPVFLSGLQSTGQPSVHFAQFSNVSKSLRKTCLGTLRQPQKLASRGRHAAGAEVASECPCPQEAGAPETATNKNAGNSVSVGLLMTTVS